MLSLFKRKTEKEKLEEKHLKLLEESFKLSKTNRSLSDQKQVEAEEVMRQILTLM